MPKLLSLSGLIEQAGRIPSLDGLRAISIALVLLAHLSGTRNFFPVTLLSYVGDIGNLGVRIFFVISGFLITTLLLAEVKKTGGVSLPWFYFRRTLRIFPAAYFFSTVMVILSLWGIVTLNPGDTLHSFTYTMNFHLNRSWYAGHLWSLSVEEQFYLLWPAAIAFLGPGRSMWVAAATFFAAPIFRTITWFFLPAYHDYIPTAFPTIADPLAIGCLLACMRGRLEKNSAYLRFLESGWIVLAPVGALVINAAMTGRPRVSFIVGQTLVNLAIALCIHRAVLIPADWAGKILNAKPLQIIGVLSYSIYLWQQMFINRESNSLWTSFPINLICVAIASLASYLLVEHPCLELRKRLEKKLKARSAVEPLHAGG